ncbi:MAG: hypothetical protein ACE5IB_03545 [Candidatus Geothermarchaeales archaeon]
MVSVPTMMGFVEVGNRRGRGDGVVASELVGLVCVLAIVLVTMTVLILAVFLGRPRAPKVSILMLGLPAALTILAIAFMWGLSALLGMVMP